MWGHVFKKKNIKLNLQNEVQMQILIFNENINHNISLSFRNLTNIKKTHNTFNY